MSDSNNEPEHVNGTDGDRVNAADALGETPQELVNRARSYLSSKKLVQRIQQDIATLGVAGEQHVAMLVYLCGTSRLLPRPVAMILQGPSSSGKSFIIHQVAKLFSPEVLLQAHRMTPQSLYHMELGSLEHKFVVAGERIRKQDDDSAEATRALREMIGDGFLSKLITVKEKGGNKFQTEYINQKGPIAFVESTTSQVIFEEDRTRCLILNTDESPTQTRRVLELIGRQSSIKGRNREEQNLIELHWTIQRLLKRCQVRIPFAKRLAKLFPAERTEARRALEQLFCVIKSVALLHQYQRTANPEDGCCIDATEADYAIAAAMVAEPMSRALGSTLSDTARRILGHVTSSREDHRFTAADIERDLSISRRTVNDCLRSLCEAGNVKVHIRGSGPNPHKYELVEEAPSLGNGNVLPSPKRLFARKAGASKPAKHKVKRGKKKGEHRG